MAKNKTKRFSSFLENPIDYTLLITILLLLALGLIMVLSASSPTSLSESGNTYSYFARQSVFAALGICAMAIISKIDYRFYKKFYKVAYVISIILLVAVLLFGRTVNEAKRWIYVTESLSFQPSEIVKFCLIIFYAGLLTKDRDELKYFFKGWAKHLALLIPIVILLLMEPHMSASIVIIGIVVIMMIMAGCKFLQALLPGLGLGVPALVILIATSEYRRSRIIGFLDPWSDSLRVWLANNSKFICNRLTVGCLEQGLAKVNKNICIYQNLKMTLYFRF